MTTVTKEEYWPAILADPAQYGQIETTDPEWNKRAACIYDVLKNTLCARDNAILTQQWENTLGLTPDAAETLAGRKAAILYHMSCTLPLNPGLLETSLELLLGAGNFEISLDNDTQTLIVHTNRISDEKLTSVDELLERVIPQNLVIEKYNHTMEISWRDINKYALCVTKEDMLAVNPDYLNDLTSDGSWVYPLPNIDFSKIGTWKDSLFADSKMTELCIETFEQTYIKFLLAYINPSYLTRGGVFNFPNATYVNNIITIRGSEAYFLKLEKFILNAPEALECSQLMHSHGGQTSFRNTTYVEVNAPKATIWTGAFARLATPKARCILDCRSASNMKDIFYGGQIDKESVLHTVNTIPTWTSGTHNITLGIHVDYKYDEEVLAAISNAEAKGWTVTVQWNGTATSVASTFDIGSVIYARVVEHEGETYLDWGHYVTDTTGYESFRSLQSAYRYFNLEMPTEEEINTTEEE